MPDSSNKSIMLSIDESDMLVKTAHALSSPLRLGILRMLVRHSMSVGELADALNAPTSSTALAVSILEDAGLIACEQLPGKRGALKLCSHKLDSIHIDLTSTTSIRQDS